MLRTRREQIAYVWSHVDKDGPDGCWLWTGPVAHDGYGKGVTLDRQCSAHRIVYHLTHGPIPWRMVLHHKCERKLCVNPDHLELLTQAEHTRHHRHARSPAIVLSRPL